MARTITLDDIKVLGWSYDVEQGVATVQVAILQSDGVEYRRVTAVFAPTLPENPMLRWYQLPATRVAQLQEITTDIRTALLRLIN